MLTLGAWYITAMGIAFVLVCLFMVLMILIQRPRGGGLAGAFGGGGGSAQAAFGAKTGDVLTWFTVACFVLFLALAMGLTWTIKPSSSPAGTKATVPATSSSTATTDVEESPDTDTPSDTDLPSSVETTTEQ